MPSLRDLSANWFTPRQDIPGAVGLMAAVLGVGLVLLLWVVLSFGGFADPTFFPSPVAVWQFADPA